MIQYLDGIAGSPALLLTRFRMVKWTCGTVRQRWSRDMAESTTRQPVATRTQILEAAEAAVLAKGFSATSIDELIAAVGISKSGFFYHFKDKAALARALLERYIATENELFDEIGRRSRELNEDPLHGFLIELKMLAEMLEDIPNGHPGCIIASYCYQDRLFDDEVRQLTANALLNWRQRFRQRLEAIEKVYPQRIDVDLDDLADMSSAIADGGIILSKVLRNPDLLPRQIMLYRAFVRSVFLGN